MVRLIEKTSCDGLLPVAVGDLTLRELPPAQITSVAPPSGQEDKLAKPLKMLGLGWPAPNTCLAMDESVIIWSGRGQAFLIGVDPGGLIGLAAMTDQSDGWARMRLQGPGVADVLARHVPLDLSGVRPGWAARTSIGHMMAVLACQTEGAIDIMVFRSMAATAVHELHGAMKALAARASV